MLTTSKIHSDQWEKKKTHSEITLEMRSDGSAVLLVILVAALL